MAALTTTEMGKRDAGKLAEARAEHVKRLLHAGLRSVTPDGVAEYMTKRKVSFIDTCAVNGLGEMNAEEWVAYVDFATKKVNGEKQTASTSTPGVKSSQTVDAITIPLMPDNRAEQVSLLTTLAKSNVTLRSALASKQLQLTRLQHEIAKMSENVELADRVSTLADNILAYDTLMNNPLLPDIAKKPLQVELKKLQDEYHALHLDNMSKQPVAPIVDQTDQTDQPLEITADAGTVSEETAKDAAAAA